jgi:hypothetical protein
MQNSKENFNFISQNIILNFEFEIEYQNIKQEFNVNIHVRVAMASKKEEDLIINLKMSQAPSEVTKL